MSTDHQKYSTENQADAIRNYANARGIDIVKTYADEGKSGLRIAGRDALKGLIEDVQNGRVDFETILVYDVSRWGRFQDADESAYYEYICKRAGITVQYCAEQFENDGSPVSTIVKGVKRAMAGEYSRELSAKVFAGQCRLIELGFRQGGLPGYGLRRVLIDQTGVAKADLNPGEQKSIQTDRVVLGVGPDAELTVVHEIYRRFVEDLTPEREFADDLNARGLSTDLRRPWTRGTVHQILINEKYIGNNIWNRVSFKLKKKRVRNDPDMWVRSDGVFPAIVERNLFDAAQTLIRARSFRMSDEEMLDALRKLRENIGILSGLIIDEADDLPSSSAYRARFGGLLRAYRLIGFTPRRDYRYIEINQELRALYPEIISEILGRLGNIGCRTDRSTDTDFISIDGELTISVIISRCHHTQSGLYRWHVRFDTSLQPDITIVIRMDAVNRAPFDYYLLPKIDVTSTKLKLAEDNGLVLDGYRFDNLDVFYDFMTPIYVAEVA
jgi:DNA invertase Pin-like site-specific DNA recombinase